MSAVEFSDSLTSSELELWAFRFANIAVYSPVEVGENGALDEAADDDLPDYINDQCPEGWSMVSDGYTRQYGYKGPVMHDSELFGDALAERVINEPGTYAIVPALYYMAGDGPDDEDCTYDIDGWVVLQRVGNE